MHYYKFNISDWVKDTAHLSLKEEAILLRLFNYYVNTESCIPLKTQMVLRKLRIADESESVEILLEEFFVKTKYGWTNKELDKTISEYQKRTDRNRLNGKSGGRPKNKDLAKPTGLPDGKQVDSESQPDGNLNHKPETTNHKPETTNHKPETIKEKKQPSKAKPLNAQEVQDYFTERGYGEPKIGNRFVDHYESLGWMRGKTKIKCWKGTARTWMSKMTPYNQLPIPDQKQTEQQQQNAYDEMLKDF